MTEPKGEKRGPGRPRVNPVDGARRNVTMQVSLDLYDKLKSAADSAGLSIGRQMEALVQSGLDGQNTETDFVEFFGGRDAFQWAASQSSLYREAMVSLFTKADNAGSDAIDDEFAARLLELVSRGQARIVGEWYNKVKFARIISAIGSENLPKAIDEAIKSKPALAEKIKAFEARMGLPPEGEAIQKPKAGEA